MSVSSVQSIRCKQSSPEPGLVGSSPRECNKKNTACSVGLHRDSNELPARREDGIVPFDEASWMADGNQDWITYAAAFEQQRSPHAPGPASFLAWQLSYMDGQLFTGHAEDGWFTCGPLARARIRPARARIRRGGRQDEHCEGPTTDSTQKCKFSSRHRYG
ncbi:hypothetical protein VTK73DRAFT_2066 [Phialemonium thermophilum]|uniref:Uncharacterized protein n=1 Tax=Phialemonium thermophilum TaxID=223376 RepID=A0ABR3VSP2_9PEZI